LTTKQVFKCGVCGLALLAGLALAQAASPAGGDSPDQLKSVLTRMDQTAEKFRTTQADFTWDQYQKVVDETETQKGTLYFRRAKGGIEMAAQITEPNKKYVLFNDSKVRTYQPPPLDRETVYNTGKHKADVETFMVLGFGGGGHALLKSFDVRYLGTEDAQGVKADKLELVPKSQATRNTFAQILLWIDPARGVSVQQKLLSPEGDYRLAKYSNIQLNPKIPDDVFKLKTTGKTTVVSPQG
jgi:outer membrane lipoprotein-sorting protein